MSARTDVRVLIAGDGEADLQRLDLSALPTPPECARGVRAAVAALRLSAFGVVVADVVAVEDALALIRAAGRGRPEARTIVLFPADSPDVMTGMDLVYRAAFAVLRHPVLAAELAGLVAQAADAYRRASAAVPARPGTRDGGPWARAERELADALQAATQRWTEAPLGDAALASIADTAGEAVRAARARGDRPGMLIHLARTLQAGHESLPREVGGAA